MQETQKWLVTADHPHEAYRFVSEPVTVEVRKDGCWAQHPRLGCGKTYRTPEDAIWHLFSDHACTGIRYRRA